MVADSGTTSGAGFYEFPLIDAVTPGCRFEWLYSRRLACISVNSSSRANVDAWIDYTKDIKAVWPTGRPMLLLVFLEGGNIIPTPYARARLREIIDLRPEQELYLAFVVKRNSLTQLFELTARLEGSAERKTTIRVFFDRAGAVQWLRDMGGIDG